MDPERLPEGMAVVAGAGMLAGCRGTVHAGLLHPLYFPLGVCFSLGFFTLHSW